MLQILKQRNFLIFWLGNLVSTIGDQLSMTAFPLLVLNLTGSPAMTGVALAVQGVPRATLMLVGGAVTDRISPRRVMLYANMARLVFMGVLALLLHLDMANLWNVLGLALLFGLADAFYFPAANAVVPSLVDKEHLQPANGLNQMIWQVALIAGPIAAGFIIAGELSNTLSEEQALSARYDDYRTGFRNAFAIDALTFLVGILTLSLIRSRNLNDGSEDQLSIIQQVKKALVFVWSIPAMRLAFMGMAMLEFFFQSPVLIGLPALTNIRFEDGASAFGQMVASYGLGALIGGGLGAITPMLSDRRMVPTMFLFFGWSSLVFAGVILYPPLWFAMLIFTTAGATDGFVWVKFMTWLQIHTPEAKLGRVMSVLLVMQVGLLPIAHVVIGNLLELDVEGVILIISLAMSALAVVAAIHPDARRMTSS